MQVASRQCLWSDLSAGTEIVVEMTPATGLYIRFVFNAAKGRNVRIRWGDGSGEDIGFTEQDVFCGHTYPSYGRYRVFFHGARSVGFRNFDGDPQYAYDAAVVSFVDYSGDITNSRSAAFKRAVNLERFVAPKCRWI